MNVEIKDWQERRKGKFHLEGKTNKQTNKTVKQWRSQPCSVTMNFSICFAKIKLISYAQLQIWYWLQQ